MQTTPAAIVNLRTNAEAEAARYRELCSLAAERMRQWHEMNGSLPPQVSEIIGPDILRQLFTASDRVEASYRAIDDYVWNARR